LAALGVIADLLQTNRATTTSGRPRARG